MKRKMLCWLAKFAVLALTVLVLASSYRLAEIIELIILPGGCGRTGFRVAHIILLESRAFYEHMGLKPQYTFWKCGYSLSPAAG